MDGASVRAVSSAGPRRLQARMRRRTRSWAWVVGFLLVLGGGISYLAWTYGGAPAVTVGEAAPPFLLEDSDGRPVNVADYLGRKPVVLVFYMTYG